MPTDRVTCLPRFPSSRRLRRARRTRPRLPRRRPNRAVEEIDRAFAVVKEELGTLIQTSTPTTKAIAYVLVVSYLVNLVLPFSATYLALVPEKTIPCVWNVFTSGFYEMNIFGLAVDAVGVMYLGRLLEPIWGTREFVNFVVVVQTCVGVAAFVTMYILYVATASQFYLFAKFSGFSRRTRRAMVALRQQLPEERVPLPAPLGALLKMRNKHLPGAYCVATAALSIASGAKHHHVGLWLFAAYGAYAGWVYLRYYQVRFVDTSAGGGGVDVEVVRGDDREEFEFAAQFPAAFAPALRAATDPCHAMCCAGRLRAERSANAAVATNVRGERRAVAPTATVAETGQRGEESGEEDARRRELAPAARSFSRRGCARRGGRADERAERAGSRGRRRVTFVRSVIDAVGYHGRGWSARAGPRSTVKNAKESGLESRARLGSSRRGRLFTCGARWRAFLRRACSARAWRWSWDRRHPARG